MVTATRRQESREAIRRKGENQRQGESRRKTLFASEQNPEPLYRGDRSANAASRTLNVQDYTSDSDSTRSHFSQKTPNACGNQKHQICFRCMGRCAPLHIVSFQECSISVPWAGSTHFRIDGASAVTGRPRAAPL